MELDLTRENPPIICLKAEHLARSCRLRRPARRCGKSFRVRIAHGLQRIVTSGLTDRLDHRGRIRPG